MPFRRLFLRLLPLLAAVDATLAAPAGALDSGFGSGGRAIPRFPTRSTDFLPVGALLVQSDDKIVLAGSTARRGVSTTALLRYTASGVLDTTFGSGGVNTVQIGSGRSYPSGVKLLADGKIVVTGASIAADGSMSCYLARFLANGVLDASFGSAGYVLHTLSPYLQTVADLELQADGKLLVCGKMSDNFWVARFSAQGALDTDFGMQGVRAIDFPGGHEEAHKLLVQPDGSILVFGTATRVVETYAGSYFTPGIARLTPAGALDTTFQSGGKMFGYATTASVRCYTAASLPGGKFGLAAAIGFSRWVYQQYNSDGTLDTSVGEGGNLFAEDNRKLGLIPYDIAVRDGVIHVAGRGEESGDLEFMLASFSKPATTWNTSVKYVDFSGEVDECRGIVFQSNGQMILAGVTKGAGGTDDWDLALARFTAAGVLDTTFGTQGRQITDLKYEWRNAQYNAAATRADGAVVATGGIKEGSKEELLISRHLVSGALDATFGDGGIKAVDVSPSKDRGLGVALANDEKIIVASCTVTGSLEDVSLLRLLSTGSLDPSFNGGSRVATGLVTVGRVGLAVQPADRKILVAAQAGAKLTLKRYNENATLDTQFAGTGSFQISGASSEASLALQQDGKIVVAGSSSSSALIIRLLPDGTLDTTFNATGKVSLNLGRINALALQPDGAIVLAGATSAADTDFLVVRLLGDGILDTSFNGTGSATLSTGTEDDEARALVIEPDGKITLAGKSKDKFFAPVYFALARFLPDGSLDDDFGPGGSVRHGLTASSDNKREDALSSVMLAAPDHLLAVGNSTQNPGTENLFETPVLLKLLRITMEPKLVFECPPGTPLAPNQPPLDFGALRARESAVHTVLVRNVGNAPLAILGISGGNGFSANLQGTDTNLAAGEATTFQLTFSPAGTGERIQTIGVGSNQLPWSSRHFLARGEGIPTKITAEPQSAIYLAGEPAVIQFQTDPASWCEWRKNGDYFYLTTSQGLQFTAFQAGDVGRYEAVANDPLGAYRSTAAYLGSLAPLPQHAVLKSGSLLSLTATAAAPPGCSLSYQWQRDGVDLSDGPDNVVTGATTRNLRVKGVTVAEEGWYVCVVTMATPDGAVSRSTGSAVYVPPAPEIPPFDLETVQVAQAVDVEIPALNWPTRFTATGLPPGVVLNALTGRLSGAPTGARALKGEVMPYLVKFTATNPAGKSAVREVPWMILPLPEKAVGTFNGLVGRHDLNSGLGGPLRIVIASTGAFTGTMRFGGTSLSLKGKLVTPSLMDNPIGSFIIARRAPLTAINGSFTVDAETGTLNAGLLDAGVGSLADFVAQRAHWGASRKAEGYAASYTAAIIPVSRPDDYSERPQGHGFLTLSVPLSGSANWSGRLSDGSTLTGSVALSEQGHVPLHQLLYTNSGSVQGWTQITDAYWDGDLNWGKGAQPAKSTVRIHRDGFPLHDLTLLGGRYVSDDWTIVTAPDLPLQEPNSTILFDGGGLELAYAQSFRIGPKPNTINIPVSPEALRVTLLPAKGLFSGSFKTGTPARKADFFGAIIPRLNAGHGYFLLPKAPIPPEPATKTPIWSGEVTLKAL